MQSLHSGDSVLNGTVGVIQHLGLPAGEDHDHPLRGLPGQQGPVPRLSVPRIRQQDPSVCNCTAGHCSSQAATTQGTTLQVMIQRFALAATKRYLALRQELFMVPASLLVSGAAATFQFFSQLYEEVRVSQQSSMDHPLSLQIEETF